MSDWRTKVRQVFHLGAREGGATTGSVLDEHFVPAAGLDLEPYVAAGDFNGTHHLIRYLWACECAKGTSGIGSVLDLACGSGFGSYLLACTLPTARVIGADYDRAAVLEAARRYRRNNLEFRFGDAVHWHESLGDEVFDLIVSFDTIEHVHHREIMLENLVAHLRDDGQVFLSTPCGGDSVVAKPEWEFHQIEYSAGSLFDFLSRYFRVVLRPDNGDLPHLEVFDRLKGSAVSYLLRMNPLICREPVAIENPYPSPARATAQARKAPKRRP